MRMGWVLRLVETGVDGSSRSVDVLEIICPGDLDDLAALGLTLAQGSTLCQVKDYRPHRIATVFGQVTVRLPRFRCAGCGGTEAGVSWPAHCRSTPELDQL